MIDQDVIERTLAVALRTGADFAEIYAEDKRNTSVVARRRSDRAGHVRPRPRRRHPCDQRRDHGLRPLQRSHASAGWPRPPRPRRQRPVPGDGGTRTVALRSSTRRRRSTRSTGTRRRSRRRRRSRCCSDRRAARSAGGEIVQVSAGYGDSRKRVLIANSDGRVRHRRHRARSRPDQRGRRRRRRHADGLPVDGPHRRLGAVRPRARSVRRPRRARAGRRPAGDRQARRPAGALGCDAGRHQERHRWCPVPRSVRPRARGRSHPEGSVGLRRQGR